MTTLADQAMEGIHELREHIEALDTHVARLEGIVQVLLEEAAAGRIEDAAAEILKALPRIE
jgi:hypothetical protein